MVVIALAKLKPYAKRAVGFKEANLGKIIIFCEGCTEYNYFMYFHEIITKHNNKFSRLEIFPVNASGNALRVLNYANDFLKEDDKIKTYSTFEKYLVFDCDSPKKIQQVINKMSLSENNYILLPTNLVFETWLLMHFFNINLPMNKVKTFEKMALMLGKEHYGTSEKASKGMIRQIVSNGDNVRLAIKNANTLEKKYANEELTIHKNILQMNPFTAIHKLMEPILIEIQKAELSLE